MSNEPQNPRVTTEEQVDAALATLRNAHSEPNRAQRDAAWARLQASLHEPARVPFTGELSTGPSLMVDRVGSSASIADTHHRSEIRPGARTTRRLGWSIAAAVVLAAGGIGVWGATPVQYTVARGGTVTPVRLPDGSRVWMAAGSSLSYQRRLTWPAPLRAARRDVTLRGTAFFDVAREDRPFRVRTTDATVQVLGTRFEVRGASARFGSRVQVEEGRVAVIAGSARIELSAGQGALVTADGLTPQPAASQGVATWRTGGLAALDEPIGAVLEELARRHAVEITADATVNLQGTVSLFYPTAPAVEVILGDLCTAQGLTFERTSRGYRVRGAVRAP